LQAEDGRTIFIYRIALSEKIGRFERN